MKKKIQIDIEKFFQNKIQLQNLIKEIEKKIFELSPTFENILKLVEEMEEIAKQRKSYYFQHRTERLKLELEKLSSKKSYNQKDFNPIYQILDKMKEEDNVYFLDSLLRNSFQKVSERFYQFNKYQQKNLYSNKKIYFTFVFRGVHFMAEKFPMKIVHNVNPQKTHVRIGSKRFPIYPGPNLGIPNEDFEEPTHLCILKSKEKEPPYRCFFFHRIEKEILFDESTVRSRLQSLEEVVSPYVQYYFRYKGTIYYLLEWISEKPP